MMIGKSSVVRLFLSMVMASPVWGKGGPVSKDSVSDHVRRSVFIDKVPIMKGSKICSSLIPVPKAQRVRHDGLLESAFSILPSDSGITGMRESPFKKVGGASPACLNSPYRYPQNLQPGNEIVLCREQSHGIQAGPEEGEVKALAKKRDRGIGRHDLPPVSGRKNHGREKKADTHSRKFALIDQNASVETRELYRKLLEMTRKNSGILFGHHLSNYAGWSFRKPSKEKAQSDVFYVTGDFPTVFGFDFCRGFDRILPYVQQAAEMGGIITCSYHMRSPYGGVYLKDSKREGSNRVVKDLLPGGDRHPFLLDKLDEIASFASRAKVHGRKIPIIFRPWHEHTGRWFWWGAKSCTADEFCQLWKFTVRYLRDVKKVNNFIYAFSPSCPGDRGYGERNPGPEWFDIAGFDSYFTSDRYSSRFVRHVLEVVKYARKHNKIAACTESGYRHGTKNSGQENWFTEELLAPLKENECLDPLAYLLIWGKGWIPQPSELQYEDFIRFYKRKEVLFLNEYLRIQGTGPGLSLDQERYRGQALDYSWGAESAVRSWLGGLRVRARFSWPIGSLEYFGL